MSFQMEIHDLEPMKLIERAEPMHVRGEHELLSMHARVAQYETDYKHQGSPEQKAWLMGARCALAWMLGLPKGGRMLERMLEGQALFGVVDPRVGTKTLESMGVKLE